MDDARALGAHRVTARVIALGTAGLIATTVGWWVIGWVFGGSDEAIRRGHVDAGNWVWQNLPAFSLNMSARDADEVFLSAQEKLLQAPLDLWLYFTRPFRGMFSDVSRMGLSLFSSVCRLGTVGMGFDRRGHHADRGVEVYSR